MVIIMKQYLSALIQKIGRLNVSIYLLLLSVGYGLYSILPYTLPKIFSGSGGLHVNPFFMVLSILSFLVVPILNYPNNLAMQSVRKYSITSIPNQEIVRAFLQTEHAKNSNNLYSFPLHDTGEGEGYEKICFVI